MGAAATVGVNTNQASERVHDGHYVRSVARRNQINGVLSMDDAFQSAYLGYLLAMKTYNPALGTSLTYSSYYMRRELQHARRKYHPGVVFPQHPSESAALPAAKAAPMIEPAIEDTDSTDDAMLRHMLRAMATLPSRCEWILRRVYGFDGPEEGCTMRDLAADLGVSFQRVEQLKRKSLARLRELLAENEDADGL